MSSCRINRNILECKSVCSVACISPTLLVLIETYWNVKLRGAYTNVLTDAVLIETYWNVKSATKLDGYQVYPWY